MNVFITTQNVLIDILKMYNNKWKLGTIQKVWMTVITYTLR